MSGSIFWALIIMSNMILLLI